MWDSQDPPSLGYILKQMSGESRRSRPCDGLKTPFLDTREAATYHISRFTSVSRLVLGFLSPTVPTTTKIYGCTSQIRNHQRGHPRMWLNRRPTLSVPRPHGRQNILLEKESGITTDPRGIAFDEDGIRLIQGIGGRQVNARHWYDPV
jgi:hypothetical protein